MFACDFVYALEWANPAPIVCTISFMCNSWCKMKCIRSIVIPTASVKSLGFTRLSVKTILWTLSMFPDVIADFGVPERSASTTLDLLHSENSFFYSKKHSSNIGSKKKFIWIEESFVDSKKFSLIQTNLFLWIKDNFFESTKLSSIKSNFFFDPILKKCFFDSKKLFSQCVLLEFIYSVLLIHTKRMLSKFESVKIYWLSVKFDWFK